MRMPARAEATGLALKNEAGSQAFRRMPSPNQPVGRLNRLESPTQLLNAETLTLSLRDVPPAAEVTEVV